VYFTFILIHTVLGMLGTCIGHVHLQQQPGN